MTYWDKQQTACALPTLKILELIKEGVAYQEWPTEDQKVLACALFPNEPLDENGQWTVEGRSALNLMRHLFKRGHFMRPPAPVKAVADQLTQEERSELSVKTFHVRYELAPLLPPWTMDKLV